MTNLPERARRLALFVLLAVLAACGPGTGGTGTGPIHPAGSFSAGASASTLLPDASCPAPCEPVRLQLQEQRVELLAACRRFVFSGDWVVDAAGVAVLHGTLDTRAASGTSSAPTTLRLQFNGTEAASTHVSVQLGSEGAAPLLGPVSLQREAAGASAAPPECVAALTPN